jgi:ABC-2 type transport system permease protein
LKRALLELHLRSLRGLVVRRMRLLRNPRYAIGLVAGLAWLGFWAGRPLLRLLGRLGPGGDGTIELGDKTVRLGDGSVQFGAGALLDRLPPEALDGIHLLVAVLITTLACLWWMAPWYRPVLRLKEAELALLLAAPLTRRQIIQYAITRNQPGILFGSLIMSVFLGSGPLPRRLGFFLTAWLFLTLWDLHSTARHIWQARTREAGGMAGLRRRLWLTGGLVVYLLAVAWVVFSAHEQAFAATLAAGLEKLPDLNTYQDVAATLGDGNEKLQAFTSYLAALGNARWAMLLLAPAWLVTAPFFTTSGLAFVVALAGPVVALVLHHEWVVRTPKLFEDAALEQARRRGQVKGRGRRQRRRFSTTRRWQPFPLPPRGLPEMAIVWKNLLQVRRMSLAILVLLGLAGLAVVMIVPALFPSPTRIYLMLGLGGAAFMIFPPLMCGVMQRHDLRVDLLHADILRAWPLSGERLVAAEIAGPVVSSTMAALLGFGLMVTAETGNRLYAMVQGRGLGQSLLPEALWSLAAVPAPVAIFLALLAVLPMIITLAAVSSGVQNLAALIFPGWVRLGKQRRSGAAQFGQNLVVMFLLMLSIAVGLIPGLLVGGLMVGIHLFLEIGIPAWEWPLLGLVMALPMAAEAAGLILLGGRRWDRLDPSAQNLSEA